MLYPPHLSHSTVMALIAWDFLHVEQVYVSIVAAWRSTDNISDSEIANARLFRSEASKSALLALDCCNKISFAQAQGNFLSCTELEKEMRENGEKVNKFMVALSNLMNPSSVVQS